jgi:threonine dehydratase
MIRQTTILRCPRLGELLGVEIILATETFQLTGSFKFRGAWHIACSTRHERLIAASSGNFGQALAFACQSIGKRCTVVMPSTAAAVKIDAVRKFGGEVDLIDVNKISRSARVEELRRQYPRAYVASGFDDDLMIKGNSTLGEELAALGPEIDAIVAPASGGGLASGIILGVKQAGARIPVIAAEPLLGNHVSRSLKAGFRVEDESESTTIADGARVKSLGIRNWAILQSV